MRPLVRTALTAATAAVLVCSAGLAGGSATAAPGTPAPTADDATKTSTVTLITGDRVTITTGADGKPSYSIAPVPGVDRTGVTFSVNTVGLDTYLIPSDVAELAGASGVLDRNLFNITRLVKEGLDDAHTMSVPLIVQRADGETVSGVSGLTEGHSVDVLGAYAAKLKKSATGDFGKQLTDAATTAVPKADVKAAKDRRSVVPRTQLAGKAGRLAGISHIWLNGKVKAADWDVNLTQVGAPTAWNAGVTGQGVKVAVLDTGIDADHPDLAGKVDAEANFTSAPSMMDIVGHGTHVAGTIAGTGAAAPGVRQGVAPGARLMIGKVLDDTGQGDLSWAVQGMQWAAQNGADIVSMSLGSGPTDGTDPVSAALNQLSEQYGSLFVVAAGNTGPAASSVSSPASADDALAVAAVDSTNTVASFSSRGPRTGDSAMKPEIAAPGVAITAPKSSGMKATTPDPEYVTMSGTSMATPHVSGVAALLKQEHPDWSWKRLKAVLMGTATAASGGTYAVGAGEANAPAALAAKVVTDTGKFDFPLGESTDPVSRTVTLTNTGDAPTTVKLGSTTDGSDVPAAALGVTPAQATIPAGGSVEATVTVDGSKVPVIGTTATSLTGALTVTPDSGTALRLPVAASRTRWLTINAHTTTGAPAAGAFTAVLNLDNGTYTSGQLGASGSVRVPVLPGRLAVTSTIQERDAAGKPINSVVTADVPAAANSIALEAKTAVPIYADLHQGGTREEMGFYQLSRVNETTHSLISNGMIGGGAYGPLERGAMRISPTKGKAEDGTVWLDEHWTLANEDSSNTTGDATRLYDLVWHRSSVPANPVHTLDKDDIKRLAKVDTDIYGLNEDAHRNQMGITAIGEEIVGLNVTTPSYVQAPVHQTRYYTANGIYWAKLGFHSDMVKGGSLSTNLSKLGITYKDGQHTSERWWGGPLGANGQAALIGDNLRTNMQDLTDSDGHLGSYGEFTFPQVGTGGMRIYRNGVALTSAGGNTPVDGSTEASYRIERAYDAQNVFPSGGRISSVWETEPVKANADGSPALLPLANVVWSARSLDLSGRLTAGRSTVLDVQATSTALDPADRRFTGALAAYTLDGGKTWRSVKAQAVDTRGHYRFTVPGTGLKTGTWLGVRFTTQDRAGNSLSQTLLRAALVR
ncbi:S8 family peptidase [Streptomyces sp. NBC_00316]|uniref:S8 family peptidase n=1 Tax=Streptomyces sp. NBC_00316 TaxID=2975710 RepID=UPI002E2B227B|nr:S8 family serine peptidase [Streptomyces sp. NBC_00316]